jgi:capsular exopolysaccharide synthesis family protein
MQKAERDGLLTWTQNDERRPAPSMVEAPPRVSRSESAVSLIDAPQTWDVPADGIAEPVHDPLGGDEMPYSPLFVVARDPGSLAAEQYRLLRTRLEGRENAGRTQVLVVTSPRVGEGKTITSANLALTMSQEFQHKVLLLEADLRRPMLAELFGVAQGPGLVDVVTGTATIDEALVTVPGQPLSLLPAGGGAARSTELLASTAMQRTLDMLRSRFDRIVIDTPPMTLADTHVITRLADGLLIVVRSGITPRPAVERALAAVDRRRLVGIVLNEVEDKPDAYSYAGAYERSASAAE